MHRVEAQYMTIISFHLKELFIPCSFLIVLCTIHHVSQMLVGRGPVSRKIS